MTCQIKVLFIIFTVFVGGYMISSPSRAEEVYRTPTIEVIGSTEDALDSIPGSGEVIKSDSLNKKSPLNFHEAVKNVPGIHIRAEDGVGLIPNIGIRGLNPDRSEKILILEDGVPSGLSPYNANAAYYIPLIERMDRVEVLKGSGSILHGPQTVGGVINLITPEVTEDKTLRFRLEGGSQDYLFIQAGAGKKVGLMGVDVQALHKQGDGFKTSSDFMVTEVSAKFKFDIADETKLKFKFNYHNQETYQTYLGLTQVLFDQSHTLNPATDDILRVQRYDLQTTLQHFFTDRIELLTNIYHSHSTRDWLRQDYSRNSGLAAAPADTASTFGDTTIDGGAIFLRESFGSRDRNFDVVGLEPRLMINYDLGKRDHDLHVGMRYHWEEMLDQRNNRATLNSTPFTFKSETREVHAFSFFAQNTFNVTDKFQVIPGIRVEAYKQARELTRNNNVEVDIQGSNTNIVPIPGLGMTYQLPKNTTLFTGFHRGFAPPRTSDAINSNGEDAELDAEKSWNYELGIRSNPTEWLSLEGTFFYLDFDNQIVPASESNATTISNSGESRHIGFEWSSSLDLLAVAKTDHKLWLSTNYTFVDTEITNESVSNQKGNRLPYAPKHIFKIGLDYESSEESWTKGLSLGVAAHYTSSQFTDKDNTETASNDGTVGQLEDYWLVDAYANYKIPKSNWTLSLAGTNIFDKKYIISRNPSGIFAGAGVQVRGGIRYHF